MYLVYHNYSNAGPECQAKGPPITTNHEQDLQSNVYAIMSKMLMASCIARLTFNSKGGKQTLLRTARIKDQTAQDVQSDL